MAETGTTLRERAVDLTADLVEYQTVASNPDEVDACMDRVAEFFAEAGIQVTRHRHDGVPSLVASLADTEGADVMFHGHLDVVPAPDRLFSPRIEGGRMYGRGTADMKGGLAAMMHVMRDAAAEKADHSLSMMVVADEERGGRHGVQYLIDDVGYSPAFCITGEPNNLDGYMDLVIKQKGVVQVEVTATGATAHAATPDNGENAIETLLAAYPDIRETFEDEEDWGATVNFGRIRGGEALNQVPESATLELDIRYPDETRRDDVLFRLRQIPGIEIHSLGHGNPVDTDPEEPHVQALKRHAERAMGREVTLARKPHTSDLRHFARQDIPGVAFGPEGYGSHEEFEHLVLGSLEDYQRALYEFATNGPYA
jgi:succinyl-diaminopimelate desuccinylase